MASPIARLQAAAKSGQTIAVALNEAMLTQNLTRAARSFGLTLSEFVVFLRRPNVESPVELSIRERAGIGIRLFILSLVVTMIFGALALPVILLTDLTSGDRLNQALSGSALSVVLSVVILGPLVEEIIFRGWLSGVWRAALGTVLSLTVIYGGSEILGRFLAEGSVVKPLVLVFGATVILFAFSPLDKARRIPGFDRVFPMMFYAQSVAFGVLHFKNYAASSLAIALFATLPLIACGLIWGYARIRLGLASAVILHAAYNVPAAIGSIIMVHYAA